MFRPLVSTLTPLRPYSDYQKNRIFANNRPVNHYRVIVASPLFITFCVRDNFKIARFLILRKVAVVGFVGLLGRIFVAYQVLRYRKLVWGIREGEVWQISQLITHD